MASTASGNFGGKIKSKKANTGTTTKKRKAPAKGSGIKGSTDINADVTHSANSFSKLSSSLSIAAASCD